MLYVSSRPIVPRVHSPQRPAVTIGAGRGDEPTADVVAWGDDEGRRPRGGAVRTAVLLGVAAGVLAVLVLSQRGGGPPAEAKNLHLVDTDGGYSLQWGYGGRLDITLPLLIRNDGPDVTVASLTLDGTDLAQPARDVELTSGGRLPVTLRQSRGCAGGVAVPDDARLRLEVRQEEASSTRMLALPAAAVAGLTEVLEVQCAAVPLDQAVVLTSEEERVRGDEVVLRVEATNISGSAVRLLSVNPVTGLQVAPAAPPTFPVLLGPEPLTLRLSVRVASCGALVQSERRGAFSVGDIGYEDGSGRTAVKTVRGDLGAVRQLLDRSC